MIHPLEQSIIQTLAYFSLFSYPLTKRELQRYLLNIDAQMNDIEQALISLQQQQQIVVISQHIWLAKEKDTPLLVRQQRFWYAKQRLDIAKRAAKKLRYIPFIQAVFVCNQLHITAHKGSDIDVFIIVKRNHIWMARLLATLWLSLLGMRRHGSTIDNHICLSFFCTDDALDMARVALPDDIYLAYWLDILIPVFDPDSYREKIIQENAWAKKMIPKLGQPPHIDTQCIPDTRYAAAMRSIGERFLYSWIGKKISAYSKYLQVQKMKKNVHSKHGQTSTDVVIDDTMLKFHERDRRAYYRDAWKAVCKRYE